MVASPLISLSRRRQQPLERRPRCCGAWPRSSRFPRHQSSAVTLRLVAMAVARCASLSVVAAKSRSKELMSDSAPTALPSLGKMQVRKAHQETSSRSFSCASAAPSAASIRALNAWHTGVRGPTLATSSSPPRRCCHPLQCIVGDVGTVFPPVDGLRAGEEKRRPTFVCSDKAVHRRQILA